VGERPLTVWGVTRHEFRLGWRSPGFWAMVAVVGVVAAFMCGVRGMSASQAGFLLGHLAGRLLGFLALFWMAQTAVRDAWLRAQDLVLAKPQHTEVLILGRFLGNYALVVVALLAMLAAGGVLQWSWGGTPWILSAYGHALGRSVVPLAYLSLLGYAFSLLFNTPVAAGVVALYWVLVLSGRDYVARIFNFTLSQNAGIYLLLTAAVLALTLLVYQPGRRAGRRWPLSLAGSAAIFFLFGLGLAVRQVLASHDPPLHRSHVLLSIAGQYAKPGDPLPGFWLPDQWGRIQGLHDHEGRILVVLLWSPWAPTSTEALEQLKQLRQEWPPEKVAILAICISEDHAVARHFARENRIPFPMLTDPGARQTTPPSAGSPLAEAYNAEDLPMVYVADRDRILQKMINFSDRVNEGPLRQAVEQLLQAGGYGPPVTDLTGTPAPSPPPRRRGGPRSSS
jgi:peroxiredoxin